MRRRALRGSASDWERGTEGSEASEISEHSEDSERSDGLDWSEIGGGGGVNR